MRKRRYFTSVGGKERKKAGAAGAGRRPERSWEGLRRIRRTSCTFVQLRRRGWRRVRVHNSRPCDFYTDEVGSESMLRAQCIPVSRLHLSTVLYVIGSSKNAPRAARGEKCRRASLAPRRVGTSHRKHSTHAQLKSITFAITLVAHAVRQARALDRRASRLEPATAFIV